VGHGTLLRGKCLCDAWHQAKNATRV